MYLLRKHRKEQKYFFKMLLLGRLFHIYISPNYFGIKQLVLILKLEFCKHFIYFTFQPAFCFKECFCSEQYLTFLLFEADVSIWACLSLADAYDIPHSAEVSESFLFVHAFFSLILQLLKRPVHALFCCNLASVSAWVIPGGMFEFELSEFTKKLIS